MIKTNLFSHHETKKHPAGGERGRRQLQQIQSVHIFNLSENIFITIFTKQKA